MTTRSERTFTRRTRGARANDRLRQRASPGPATAHEAVGLAAVDRIDSVAATGLIPIAPLLEFTDGMTSGHRDSGEPCDPASPGPTSGLTSPHRISSHAPLTRLTRHRHTCAYVAVVLTGGFIEAGDGPRIRAGSGDVIVHRDYEAHQDDFAAAGAVVLNLPVRVGTVIGSRGVCDPEEIVEIVEIAERDPAAASAAACTSMRPGRAALNDWPDQLAAALASDPDVVLAEWALAAGIAPQSLSRGFRLAYGVSAKLYRLEQRGRQALQRLHGWPRTLAELAAETGFADQAHLTRTMVALTGVTPGRLRVKSIQSRGASPG